MKTLLVNSGTYCNDLCIEWSPTGITKCRLCGENVALGDVRVSFKRRWSKSHYFHLDCFTPITHVRVDINDSNFRDAKQLERVQAWAESWNKQFSFDETLILNAYRKRVRSNPPSNRRVLLEIFKYLSPATILHIISPICKSWYHVSCEDELWLCVARSVPYPAVHNKTEFLLAYMSTCAHCGRSLPQDCRHMVCPLTHRPKCVNCYSNAEFRPMYLPWVERQYGIKPKLIRQLSVPIFQFDGHNCVYLYQLLGKVTRYRRTLAVEIADKKSTDGLSLIPEEFCTAVRNSQDSDFADASSLLRLIPNLYNDFKYQPLWTFIFAGEKISKLPETITECKQRFEAAGLSLP